MGCLSILAEFSRLLPAHFALHCSEATAPFSVPPTPAVMVLKHIALSTAVQSFQPPSVTASHARKSGLGFCRRISLFDVEVVGGRVAQGGSRQSRHKTTTIVVYLKSERNWSDDGTFCPILEVHHQQFELQQQAGALPEFNRGSTRTLLGIRPDGDIAARTDYEVENNWTLLTNLDLRLIMLLFGRWKVEEL